MLFGGGGCSWKAPKSLPVRSIPDFLHAHPHKMPVSKGHLFIEHEDICISPCLSIEYGKSVERERCEEHKRRLKVLKVH